MFVILVVRWASECLTTSETFCYFQGRQNPSGRRDNQRQRQTIAGHHGYVRGGEDTRPQLLVSQQILRGHCAVPIRAHENDGGRGFRPRLLQRRRVQAERRIRHQPGARQQNERRLRWKTLVRIPDAQHEHRVHGRDIPQGRGPQIVGFQHRRRMRFAQRRNGNFCQNHFHRWPSCRERVAFGRYVQRTRSISASNAYMQLKQRALTHEKAYTSRRGYAAHKNAHKLPMAYRHA